MIGMRCRKRLKRTIYYCLYSGKQTVTDSEGYEVGTRVVYDEDQPMTANVSAASGYAQTEQFGNLDSYDKVIVTDWAGCPIDENTVLFVDKEPAYSQSGDPLYDYTVKRVARSLHSVSIAISKVQVT